MTDFDWVAVSVVGLVLVITSLVFAMILTMLQYPKTRIYSVFSISFLGITLILMSIMYAPEPEPTETDLLLESQMEIAKNSRDCVELQELQLELIEDDFWRADEILEMAEKRYEVLCR